MNNINVYDIAKSSWYTQATTGETPALRVNPCAVVAAAPDGTSYNVYMFVSGSPNDRDPNKKQAQMLIISTRVDKSFFRTAARNSTTTCGS